MEESNLEKDWPRMTPFPFWPYLRKALADDPVKEQIYSQFLLARYKRYRLAFLLLLSYVVPFYLVPSVDKHSPQDDPVLCSMTQRESRLLKFRVFFSFPLRRCLEKDYTKLIITKRAKSFSRNREDKGPALEHMTGPGGDFSGAFGECELKCIEEMREHKLPHQRGSDRR